MAPDLELPEVAGHHLRHRADVCEICCRGHRQQIPDPDLCGRRARPRPAGARCGQHSLRRHGADPALFLHRQGAGAGLCDRRAVRHEPSSSGVLVALHFGGGADLTNEALKPFKAHAILCGNSGTQMGGWFRKEIKTVDDLKGLKFRIAGMGGHVLARLGVVPQQIAGGDIYPALEKGTIDAVEFVGPYDDEKLGFQKVAKYYYFPGWWEGGAMLHMIVNDEKWASLPKQYQAIVNQAASAAGAWMLEKYDSVNPAALKRLIANGAELKAFPQPVLEACYAATQEHLNELATKSDLFKRTKESHDAYMKELLFYTQIAENFYDNYLLGKMRNKA